MSMSQCVFAFELFCNCVLSLLSCGTRQRSSPLEAAAPVRSAAGLGPEGWLKPKSEEVRWGFFSTFVLDCRRVELASERKNSFAEFDQEKP